MFEISLDKKTLINKLEIGSAYIIQGEAGTGKTFAGILCGQELLESQPPWQKVMYLTYSKLAKWQIDKTRLMLETKGFVSPSQSKRMYIQNFHSLWWNLVRDNSNFLGLSSNLRICLNDELKQLSDDCLRGLTSQERKEIIPSYFLKQDGEYDNSAGHFNKLSQTLQGEAILYAQWGPEHFGSRAEKFIGENKFLAWAKSIIEQRNRKGFLSHAETIWWAHKLILKHPTILNLTNVEYPVVIIDEFQDTDIAQWEMLRLLSSETIIVMSDAKQTIHGWRGASPEKRLNEFIDFGRESKKYSDVLEFVLTERHRSQKNMSDNDNVTRVYVKSDGPLGIDMPRKRTLWKCKNLLNTYKGKTVGVLCLSNSLAEEITNSLRQTQKNKSTGKIFGYPLICCRLGAANSPFELVRTIVHQLLRLVDGLAGLQSFVANELHWLLLPVPKSKLPKCGGKSQKRYPVKRWKCSKILSKHICSDFGYGILLLKKYFIKQEACYACRCDRTMLNCLSHIGKSIQKLGRSWHGYDIQEQIAKIDSLAMQYENAYASSKREKKISVMTVHQSKGREFDIIIIPWFNKLKWNPKDSLEWDTSTTEVVNIFHTACTRAKEKVFVIATKESEAMWPVRLE